MFAREQDTADRTGAGWCKVRPCSSNMFEIVWLVDYNSHHFFFNYILLYTILFFHVFQDCGSPQCGFTSVVSAVQGFRCEWNQRGWPEIGVAWEPTRKLDDQWGWEAWHDITRMIYDDVVKHIVYIYNIIGFIFYETIYICVLYIYIYLYIYMLIGWWSSSVNQSTNHRDRWYGNH